MDILTICGLLFGVVLNILGLCFEIRGVSLVSNDIFMSDDTLERLNDFPIDESTTNLHTKTKLKGVNPNDALPVIVGRGVQEFKKMVYENSISVKEKSRRGFKILLRGLVFQITGVLLLVGIQIIQVASK